MNSIKILIKSIVTLASTPTSSAVRWRGGAGRYLGCLALAGVVLFLLAMPAINEHTMTLINERNQGYFAPRLASLGNYQYTIGTTGVSGTDNTHLNQSAGVAVNATGHVYVADTYNNRVQVFDNAGHYQYSIGEAGVPGMDNAHFNHPYGVAVNSTGHLYVADQLNQRVQVFDNAGHYQYTIGVTGVSGSDNLHLNAPTGVAINASGHLYVADSTNHRVQVFDNAGHYQYTIGVAGVPGTDNAHFFSPTGVALNSSGHLYVADSYNHRVQVFDNAGHYQYTIGVTGVSGSDNAHFNLPCAVAVNATDWFYIVEYLNQRVQVFNSTGVYRHTVGVTGVSGSDNAHFYGPFGVAVNATGHLYVADLGNHRVQVFESVVTAPTGLLVTINGGVADTGSTSVTLTLYAIGASEMCFSNDGITYSAWEAYGPTKTWTLAGGPGVKTVYFNARNSTIAAAAPASDTITYVVPPFGLSLTINGGAGETGSTSVTLTLSATAAAEMCFSNDNETYSAWEAYGPTKTWTLAGGPGVKTVYFKVRNSTLEVDQPAHDNITYVVPPSGLSITIVTLFGEPAEQTDTLSVTLIFSATGAKEVCFSNDGIIYTSWIPIEAYFEGKVPAWDLQGSLPGVKTVYMKARNGTIEAAAPATDTITYTTGEGGISGFPTPLILVAAGCVAFYLARKGRR